MLGVTGKSFGHLSGGMTWLGGAPLADDRPVFCPRRPRYCFSCPPTPTHWLLLDRAVSWASVDIRGYAPRNIGKHGKPCTGLPSEASALKGTRVQTLPLAPPLSTPQFLADKTTPCYVRSLPDLLDVCPSGNNTFLMMYGFNWQEVSVGC